MEILIRAPIYFDAKIKCETVYYLFDIMQFQQMINERGCEKSDASFSDLR